MRNKRHSAGGVDPVQGDLSDDRVVGILRDIDDRPRAWSAPAGASSMARGSRGPHLPPRTSLVTPDRQGRLPDELGDVTAAVNRELNVCTHDQGDRHTRIVGLSAQLVVEVLRESNGYRLSFHGHGYERGSRRFH